MGRHRREKPHLEGESPVSQRINLLLKYLWSGNIAAMSRDLDVSHAALSRVLAGQMPSGKMLAALADRDIDFRWLLSADDKPTIEGLRSTRKVYFPVAKRLLPGNPDEHPEMMTLLALPAASPFLLESAYWLRTVDDMPVVSDKSSRVPTDAYMLIETASRWTRRSEAYLGRLVAIRLPDDRDIILAKVVHNESIGESGQHDLKTFGVFADARLFPALTRDVAQANPPMPFTAGSDLMRFYEDDVVGVVLQTVNFLEYAIAKR